MDRAYTISDIPDDIIVEIHLFYVIGFIMRLVCTKWRDAITKTSRFVKKINLHKRRSGWYSYLNNFPNESIKDACEYLWNQKPRAIYITPGCCQTHGEPVTRAINPTNNVFASVEDISLPAGALHHFGSPGAIYKIFPNLKKIGADRLDLVLDVIASVEAEKIKISEIIWEGFPVAYDTAITVIERGKNVGVDVRFASLQALPLRIEKEKWERLLDYGYIVRTNKKGRIRVFHPTRVPANDVNVLEPDVWSILIAFKHRSFASKADAVSPVKYTSAAEFDRLAASFDPLGQRAINYHLQSINVCQMYDAEMALVLSLCPNLRNVRMNHLLVHKPTPDDYPPFSHTPKNVKFIFQGGILKMPHRICGMVRRDETNLIAFAVSAGLDAKAYSIIVDHVNGSKNKFSIQLHFGLDCENKWTQELWRLICQLPGLSHLLLLGKCTPEMSDVMTSTFIESRKRLREQKVDYFTRIDGVSTCFTEEAMARITRELNLTESHR
tara:strand:+ start:2847 stop:4334 length:1488 start_codon:yes stop_codon:yes gene_type:complete